MQIIFLQTTDWNHLKYWVFYTLTTWRCSTSTRQLQWSSMYCNRFTMNAFNRNAFCYYFTNVYTHTHTQVKLNESVAVERFFSRINPVNLYTCTNIADTVCTIISPGILFSLIVVLTRDNSVDRLITILYNGRIYLTVWGTS